MSRPRLIALLLAFITLLVFFPAGRFSFVNFDDTEYVTENSAVKPGLTFSSVQWAMTSFHASNWHPVTWLSHMTDCSLFGLNPGAHHFVNVLFHAVNAALLFILLWRITQNLWPSAFVAALFAWHPLHVESVAWISERKDVLSTLFALLALLSYVTYARTNSRRSWWFALVFFALGLMSKPMLVTLPFVMLLLDFWPFGRIRITKDNISNGRPLLTEKIPFFMLSAISCVITYIAQQSGQSVISLENVPLGFRLENASVSVVGYIQKLLWPSGLCVIYPMADKINALQVVLALAALLLITIAAWRWRASRPYFITGWLWFLGMLVPVIGLVQVGGQAMADRYTYLPSIGFFIALVFLGNEIAAQMQTPQIIRFGLAGMISCACIITTERQLSFWSGSEALFRRAIDVTKNNDIALINLGAALDVQRRFEEAVGFYRQAEAVGHHRFEVYNNLGNIFSLMGRHTESLAEYQKALELEPDNARLHKAIGSELAVLNQFDQALAEFSTAQRLDPNYAAVHMEAAKTLFKIGRDQDGLNAFQIALRLDPNNFQTLATVAHYLAANENAAARDGQSALTLIFKADALSGHVQPVVQDYLGMAWAETGNYSNAVICAQNALALASAAGMTNTGAMQLRLDLYQKKMPWHESFRATNAP